MIISIIGLWLLASIITVIAFWRIAESSPILESPGYDPRREGAREMVELRRHRTPFFI